MDISSDQTTVTECTPSSSRPIRRTAEADGQLFRTSQENAFDYPSSDKATVDVDSESDGLPSTSAVALEPVTSDPPPAKRAKKSASAAERENAEAVSNWRLAHINEEVGTPTNSFDDSCTLPDVGAERTPLTYFLALLTPDILDSLIDSINYSAVVASRPTRLQRGRRLRDWVPIERNEMYKFLATIIAMGMQPKPRISDYWTTTPHMCLPFFEEMFSWREFKRIYDFILDLSEPSQGKADIEPFVNQLLASFQRAIYPFSDLSINEMVIGNKGCWGHKRYDKSKPAEYHIKTFGLCDSITGYVFNLLIYFGYDISYNPTGANSSSEAVKVFDTLLQPVRSSHHIFADGCYTSLALIEYLQAAGHNYTGTLNVNHVGFPPELKTLKIAPEEAICHVKDGEKKVLCVSWRNKESENPVHIVTTCGKAVTTRIEGQEGAENTDIIHSYNTCMRGCDRVNQNLSYYGLHTRQNTGKWWKNVFTWILEVVQVNAQILYLVSEEPAKKEISLAWFKHQLVEGLTSLTDWRISRVVAVSSARPLGRSAQAPVADRFHGRHLVNYEEANKCCAYCSRPDNEVCTQFYCTTCSDRPHLCPKECFQKYHESSSA